LKENLILQLNNVKTISEYSKFRRFLNNPIKYINAIFHREILYPRTQKEKIVVTNLFWGKKMIIALPASIDIYLTGGKSHSSEIRLAIFLIKNLQKNEDFLDIGAHFGYFTLLASEIVGENGRVISFEPTLKSFELLHLNSKTLKNVNCFQKAISDSEEKIVFYEFPNLHSEYNSSDVSQFENENWFKDSVPQKVEVNATTIDLIAENEGIRPRIIKIDVEGAELNVIRGGLNYIKKYSPIIVMEYLEPQRKNDTHKEALKILLSVGYKSYLIEQDGNLISIDDIDNYLILKKLESDNIVFLKN
jgi:FkbM family methyltransferase